MYAALLSGSSGIECLRSVTLRKWDRLFCLLGASPPYVTAPSFVTWRVRYCLESFVISKQCYTVTQSRVQPSWSRLLRVLSTATSSVVYEQCYVVSVTVVIQICCPLSPIYGVVPKRLLTCLGSLFCSRVYVCLYDPFNCISFHKFSRQLSAFWLCSSGLLSALLVFLTICLFMKVSFSPDIIPSGCFSPDVILCGWLGSKHQLTN